MQLIASTIAFLFSPIALFSTISNLSAASPVSFRYPYQIVETQLLLCTTKDQTTVPYYSESCKACNCYCLQEALLECNQICEYIGILDMMWDEHECPGGVEQSYSPDSKNDGIYIQTVLEGDMAQENAKVISKVF